MHTDNSVIQEQLLIATVYKIIQIIVSVILFIFDFLAPDRGHLSR